MDRPEHPEPPSIFTHPDPAIEDLPEIPAASADGSVDDWTRAVQSAANQPIRPPDAPLAPHRPPAGSPSGPSRTAIAAIGGGGLLILALAGFIVVSLMGRDETPAAVETTASPTASASATTAAQPSEDSSPSGSPTPTPKPAAAVRLTADEWATVTLDVVNVRSQPSLEASLIGSANQGEIVYILDGDTEQADGMTWYRAATSPGVTGWMAGHTAVDQYITPDEPTTSVRWCAVPDDAVFEFEPGGPYGPAAPELLETASVGGLPIATELLGSAGSGIIELAWGTQDQVCLDLAITDGRTREIGLSASIEGCGYPFGGAPALVQFGTGAVDSGGGTDSRRAVLDPTVIGYDPFTAGTRPNLSDVMTLASMGGLGAETAQMCVTASASGAATAPRIEFSAGTTQCAWVSSRTNQEIVLNSPDGDWEMAELRLTDGSFVGEGVTQQTHSYGAEKGFRVSAERGVDGSVGISVRPLEGCGT